VLREQDRRVNGGARVRRGGTENRQVEIVRMDGESFEETREGFCQRLQGLAPGTALAVVLVPNEDGRALGKADALTCTRALAHRCPQAEAICRIGWARFAVISRATKRELLEWASRAVPAMPEPIRVGIGATGPKPVESLSVLELGTHEASADNPAARVFVLDEGEVRGLPAGGR
jgi:hypothetical protein